MRRFLSAVAGGALIAYFTDPQSGARRRNVARDRVAAFLRRRSAEAERKARYAAGFAEGAAAKAKQAVPTGGEKEYDDVTLARKVESEVFRPEGAPKGAVDVNAEYGVVYLRGEVERQDQIDDLEARTRKVEGVTEVVNLLHLPGQPARSKDGRKTPPGQEVAREERRVPTG